MQPEHKGYDEFRSHSLLALHLYGAVHHVHDILGDGHSQPCALNPADGAGCLPLKGLENMLKELRAHADAVIPDSELIFCISRRGSALFRDSHAHDAACSGILDGIAQQVQKHLIQPEPVTVYLLVYHVHSVYMKLQLLCMDIRLHNIA